MLFLQAAAVVDLVCSQQNCLGGLISALSVCASAHQIMLRHWKTPPPPPSSFRTGIAFLTLNLQSPARIASLIWARKPRSETSDRDETIGRTEREREEWQLTTWTTSCDLSSKHAGMTRRAQGDSSTGYLGRRQQGFVCLWFSGHGGVIAMQIAKTHAWLITLAFFFQRIIHDCKLIAGSNGMHIYICCHF